MSPQYSGADHQLHAMELGMLTDMGWTISGGGSSAASGYEDSGSAGPMLTAPGRMVERRAQRVTSMDTTVTHVLAARTPSGTRFELVDDQPAPDSLQTAWAIDQILDEAEPSVTSARHQVESLALYDLIAKHTQADEDLDETEALDLVLQLEDEWTK